MIFANIYRLESEIWRPWINTDCQKVLGDINFVIHLQCVSGSISIQVPGYSLLLCKGIKNDFWKVQLVENRYDPDNHKPEEPKPAQNINLVLIFVNTSCESGHILMPSMLALFHQHFVCESRYNFNSALFGPSQQHIYDAIHPWTEKAAFCFLSSIVYFVPFYHAKVRHGSSIYRIICIYASVSLRGHYMDRTTKTAECLIGLILYQYQHYHILYY